MSDAITNASPAPAAPLDFIRQIVSEDLKAGRHGSRVHTRFPPEPNGYLHIGHAKSICLNFGVAAEFGGLCNLRLDDTNPTKEDVEYVDSIRDDVRWLGFDWDDAEFYASDYFEQIYECAVALIRAGPRLRRQPERRRDPRVPRHAHRAGPQLPVPRPARSTRTCRCSSACAAGEFPDGAHVLRAKIDMASPNMNMRDPTLYRIRHAHHHRTGDKWCIYPMYDFAHAISDALEGITHSLCTLEFEDHRPLYDWIIEQFPDLPGDPQQIEFARLNLTYTVMSKRKLLELVEKGIVAGWDDPRMPTISGHAPPRLHAEGDPRVLRAHRRRQEREPDRRGAARAQRARGPEPGRAAGDGRAQAAEGRHRELPRGAGREMEAVNNPEDDTAGTRQVPFTRELYIEQDDFREVPPKKFFRLSPGNEVRLRYAYIIKCESIVKNDAGEVVEVHCTYDPDTRGGSAGGERRVKGTLHWVSSAHAVPAEVRLYDRLFTTEQPGTDEAGTSPRR